MTLPWTRKCQKVPHSVVGNITHSFQKGLCKKKIYIYDYLKINENEIHVAHKIHMGISKNGQGDWCYFAWEKRFCRGPLVHWYVLYELNMGNKVIWLRWILFVLCEKLIQYCCSFDEVYIKLFPSYRSAYHLVHEMCKTPCCTPDNILVKYTSLKSNYFMTLRYAFSKSSIILLQPKRTILFQQEYI